jgi:hypothetical protein
MPLHVANCEGVVEQYGCVDPLISSTPATSCRLFFDPTQEKFAKLLQARRDAVVSCEDFDCYVICIQILYVIYGLMQYFLLVIPVKLVTIDERVRETRDQAFAM